MRSRREGVQSWGCCTNWKPKWSVNPGPLAGVVASGSGRLPGRLCRLRLGDAPPPPLPPFHNDRLRGGEESAPADAVGCGICKRGLAGPISDVLNRYADKRIILASPPSHSSGVEMVSTMPSVRAAESDGLPRVLLLEAACGRVAATRRRAAVGAVWWFHG